MSSRERLELNGELFEAIVLVPAGMQLVVTSHVVERYFTTNMQLN